MSAVTFQGYRVTPENTNNNARELSKSRKGLNKLVLPYLIKNGVVFTNHRLVSFWNKIFRYVYAPKSRQLESVRYLCQLFRDSIPPPVPYMMVPSQFPTVTLALDQLSKERLPTTAFAQPLENYPYLPVKTLKENGDGTFNVTFLHAVNLDLSRNTSVTTVQNIQSKQVQIPESGKKNGSKKIKIQEIRIEEGTYDGNIIISIPDVTITGSGSKKTIIHGSITVTGKKAKNIHLKSLTLDGSKSFENGFWDPTGNSHASVSVDKGGKVEVENCEIINSGGAGCGVVDDGSHLHMKDCIVSNSKRAGIVACDNSTLEIFGCKTINNGMHGFDINTGATAKVVDSASELNSHIGIVAWDSGHCTMIDSLVHKNGKNGEQNFHTLKKGNIIVKQSVATIQNGGVVRKRIVQATHSNGIYSSTDIEDWRNQSDVGNKISPDDGPI
jgi:hypothetical protein